MSMLAERVDHVIGVDTHRDAHTAAVLDAATGAVLAVCDCPANPVAFKRLLRFARLHAESRRVWAIESSGSYGSSLTVFLLEHDEQVVEIDRPARPARRNGAKSDELDAIRAAREALSREHLAQPRCRGDREAVRVLLITRRGAMRARTRAITTSKRSWSPAARSCATSCAPRRRTSSSSAAPGCAPPRHRASNTARP